MRIKIVLLVIMLSILFLFPEKVQAGQNGYLHYYSSDGEGGLVWIAEEIEIDGQADAEERARILFMEFFESGRVGFVPEDVRLLNAWQAEGALYLDVSEEILRYGGSYYERCLISQIVRTALELEGVSRVTLLIENELCGLAEGSLIDDVTTWTDMTINGS